MFRRGVSSSFYCSVFLKQSSRSNVCLSPSCQNTVSFRLFSSLSTSPKLTWRNDSFGGIEVDTKSLPLCPETFRENLENVLQEWRGNQKRGVWMFLPVDKLGLLSTAIAQGFEIHHGHKGGVMLTNWLPTTEPNNMPPMAHHFVGVGGFVLRNDTNQVLVVKEKIRGAAASPSNNTNSTATATNTNTNTNTNTTSDNSNNSVNYSNSPKPALSWKLPGGLQDVGESLAQAVEREVFEETGVRSRFRSILAFRHKHQYKFGQDDLYFVCRLEAITTDLLPCTREVSDCKWMDLEEYVGLAAKGDVYPLQAAAIKCAVDEGVRKAEIVATEIDPLQIDALKARWAKYGTQRLYHPSSESLDLTWSNSTTNTTHSS